MADFNREEITREDCVREYSNHMKDRSQTYYKVLQNYANKFAPKLGRTPFGKEGWKDLVENEGLFKSATNMLATEMFKGNEVLQGRFTRLMNNSRDVTLRSDIGNFGLEGWGGGNAVYASSQGAFAIGATPFVIGGWLATARSEEIFQHIDNQNAMRLEFEYNIDYLQIGDKKKFFPQAFRGDDGITGFNKLPIIDWEKTNRDSRTGAYTPPPTMSWAGLDRFIMLQKEDAAASAPTSGLTAKGNFILACGGSYNKRANGIEPNCRFTRAKYFTCTDPSYKVENAEGDQVRPVNTARINLQYHIATGATNERTFKAELILKNVSDKDPTDPSANIHDVLVDIYMKINLDTGDFVIMTNSPSAEENILIGLQFDGKFSNIANEMTNIPTTGTDKYQFVRECEYRNYAKVSLNEYMADNFRIGSNNNISYAAYATDRLLQYTVFNRELEAEDFLMNEVLADDIDLDSFELTRKMGGFLHNNVNFTIGRFAPGMQLQTYKEGLKNHLMKVLSTSETDLNLPNSVKREWIFMGYDAYITEFPEIRFENAVIDLNKNPEGSAANENYGFGQDTKCGFIDSLGRAVRIMGNTDSRWRDKYKGVYGCLRTYSMEYPFLVYYPHAIRMYTAIDADNPNRTAIYIGGREYRGHFAAAALELHLHGVLNDAGVPINNFDVQMNNAHTGYEYKVIQG